MKRPDLKTILILLLLAGTVNLTTGIDQVLHILVCHGKTACHMELPKDESSHHSDSDEYHCPVCQYFACNQNQTVLSDIAVIVISLQPALWSMPDNIFSALNAFVHNKSSRAPPRA